MLIKKLNIKGKEKKNKDELIGAVVKSIFFTMTFCLNYNILMIKSIFIIFKI